MESTRIKINTLLTVLLAVIAIEALMITVHLHLQVYPLIITGMARTVQAIVILWIVCERDVGMAAIGLSRVTLLHGMKKGLMWAAGFGLVVALAGAVFFLTGRNPAALIKSRPPVHPLQIALLFIIGGLIGPVAEEIFFRGIIYSFFRRWGIFSALLVSTLVFVLIHPVRGPAVTQAIGGILFGIAFEVEKNLMVPITIHALGNMAIFTISAVF
jgi:membrane protease YdiL (CAAX protease family)